MLYEIDAFGFTPGYITKRWTLMSEEDMLRDEKLRRELQVTKYEVWKRHNIDELLHEYNKQCQNLVDFDRFCKKLYQKIINCDYTKK